MLLVPDLIYIKSYFAKKTRNLKKNGEFSHENYTWIYTELCLLLVFLHYSFLSLTFHLSFIFSLAFAAAAAKSLQSCPTLCDPIDGSLPGSPVPLGKNTGVGCHFFLQCMKVKSESEVTQSQMPKFHKLGSPSGSVVKNPPAMQEPQKTKVQSLGWEDPLKEGKATHSSILAWWIPMDREAWQAMVRGVTKCQTWLKWLNTHTCKFHKMQE